jgi:hypothetical protein
MNKPAEVKQAEEPAKPAKRERRRKKPADAAP